MPRYSVRRRRVGRRRPYARSTPRRAPRRYRTKRVAASRPRKRRRSSSGGGGRFTKRRGRISSTSTVFASGRTAVRRKLGSVVSYTSKELSKYRPSNVSINTADDSVWCFSVPYVMNPNNKTNNWWDGGDATTGGPTGNAWDDKPRWVSKFDDYQFHKVKHFKITVDLDLRFARKPPSFTGSTTAPDKTQVPLTDYCEIVDRSHIMAPWGNTSTEIMQSHNSESLKDIIRLMSESGVGLRHHGIHKTPFTRVQNQGDFRALEVNNAWGLDNGGKRIRITKVIKNPYFNAQKHNLIRAANWDERIMQKGAWLRNDYVNTTSNSGTNTSTSHPAWAIWIRRHHEGGTETELNDVKVVRIRYDAVADLKGQTEDLGYADNG